MNMHFLFGFLLVTFVVHFIAFTVLGIVRRKKYYFFLSGTFACLTAIYYLKFNEFFPNIPNTAISAIVALRVGAICCTCLYLITIARIEGTWFNRLLARKSRRT